MMASSSVPAKNISLEVYDSSKKTKNGDSLYYEAGWGNGTLRNVASWVIVT